MNVRYRFLLSILLMGSVLILFTYVIDDWLNRQYFLVKRNIPKSNDQKENDISFKTIDEAIERKNFRAKLDVPKKQAYLGIDSDQLNKINEFEQLTGKNVAAINSYIYWGDRNGFDFDKELAARLWVENKFLIITWNPSKSIRSNPINQPRYRVSNILNGGYDSYLRRWATNIKEWNKPVIIRFAPEMNGYWIPWGTRYTTPEEYKETYRYVVNFFRNRGVDNVSWMWSPNEAGEENILDYYPGDNYVDWVGLSGFNWGGAKSFQSWRSMEQIFNKSLKQLTNVKKPVAFVEFGCVEKKADNKAKAEWIKDSFLQLPIKYPNVKMIIWSNNKSFNTYDWRVDTSENSLNAFRKAISNKYYIGEIKENL